MSEHGHDKEDPLKAQTSFEPVKQFVPGPRMFGYGVGFFIYFALSTTAMAMAGTLLHRHGNTVYNYPNAEVKHAIGLSLFNGILSMLIALGSYAAPLYFLSFITFASSVIWVCGAGVLFQSTPFHGSSCGAADTLPLLWQAATGDCKEYLTLHALSWTIWIISLILSIAILVNTIMSSKAGHPFHTLYGQ